MLIRCCLCRNNLDDMRERAVTNLPGGYRCVDRAACRQRVRGIVAAHKGFGEMCDE